MTKTIETSGVWNGGEITKDMYSEMQGAMLTSAEGIAGKARQLVPVGDLSKHTSPANPTLHLRDTIRARARRKRSGLEGLARGIVSGQYETALPGAWVFAGDRNRFVYWHWMVEFGTYGQPAHPFMRPAVDSNFNAVQAHTERAGRRVLLKRRRTRAAAKRRRIEGLQG